MHQPIDDHARGLEFQSKAFPKVGHCVHYLILKKNGGIVPVYNRSCFGGMAYLANMTPKNLGGIYLVLNNPDSTDRDEGTRFAKGVTFNQEYIDRYLQFVLSRKKSPWRKLMRTRVVFTTGKKRTMVFLPITSKTNYKFLLNCMTAIRASWYNYGFVHLWNKLVESGLDEYEAMYVAAHFIIRNLGESIETIKFRNGASHFFFDPARSDSSPDQFRKAAPSLPALQQQFDMTGLSRVWNKDVFYYTVPDAGFKASKLPGLFGSGKYSGKLLNLHGRSGSSAINRLVVLTTDQLIKKAIELKPTWSAAA